MGAIVPLPQTTLLPTQLMPYDNKEYDAQISTLSAACCELLAQQPSESRYGFSGIDPDGL